MIDNDRGWIGTKLGGLSTGPKMLVILAAVLLPLGIVAVLASVYSARDNASRDRIELRALLHASAQRFNIAVGRVGVVIQAAAPALSQAPAGADLCRRTIQRMMPVQIAQVRYAIFAPDGRALCTSPGYAPPPDAAAARRSRLEISEDGRLLSFMLVDSRGRIEGAGEFSLDALARVIRPAGAARTVDIDLIQNGRTMALHRGGRPGSLQRQLTLSERVSGGLELRLRAAIDPINAAELLMILLPILMLLAAAFIGWWIADRLLLRPLARMQGAIAAYRPGDPALDLPSGSSPAREIADLGRSFNDVTRTVARHEAELEAAVERQTRLVREVHHRVKNNLQVVASLLNLHARGSKSEDVAAAYASIQRRVDALAVVHRNHYAELEENRGVALRSLVSELAANLRATAPASASHMQIRLDVEPFYGTQDVAVSVAFLVTEIAEFGMLCGATWVAITLEGAEPGFATLAVESDSLAGEIHCDPVLFERFDRIITGLSRQLRSTLERVPEQGRYAVRIGVVDRAEH